MILQYCLSVMKQISIVLTNDRPDHRCGKEMSMTRSHGLRSLARREIEEASIKMAWIFDPTAILYLRGVLALARWIVVCRYIPSIEWNTFVNIEAL